jgi:hypothetical protein
MAMPPRARSFFAYKHMEDAATRLKMVSDARRQQSEDDRRTYEKFYTNLALISGGTVALSVTFLGYLKTGTTPVLHKSLLVGSWACLITCLIVSLFYILFNAHYGFHFMEREYYEALQNKYETEVTDVDEIGDVANLETPEDRERFKAPRRANALASQKYVNFHNRREKLYQWLWIWTARLSYVGFVGGLTLLLLFAIKNT